MFGNSGKIGRGGGRGSKRIHNSFPPPPSNRSAAAVGSGRLSMGGAAPRNRNANPEHATSATPAVEETFKLITGNPLNFAMIIRLAPDLIEEIKRVEAQGGTARIKFGSNANNPSGNVIDVGGKDFSFTWSREPGDLCDIYEERQSGEHGNGLLVESGCAWRKLNVQRILDESTKNHVKMRSEEAERKLKSRKAIVLDHGNPSMKSQMKAFAAVESNSWRTPFKKKEPAFKKQKVEPPQGLPKSVHKYGVSTTATVKGRKSSPLPSPPDISASSFGTGNVAKSIDDAVPTLPISKSNVVSSDKETLSRGTNGKAKEAVGQKDSFGVGPMDLQDMLISLLMENPKGMSLKALEKVIGEPIPKLEPVIKKIATYQAPGRYFLKPGVQLGAFKKPLSESGSSPEDNHHQTPAPTDNRNPPDQGFEEKATIEESKSKAGDESQSFEKIEVQQNSPDLFGDKKVGDSEGQAGSSSGSGSDSDGDSDSSDSGSDSASHSRSRSPVASGSVSSSASDTEPSCNSKEGSDEDVDIMTSEDDNKEVKSKIQNGGNSKKQEDKNELSFDAVEIEKDLPCDDHETEKTVEEVKSFSPQHYEHPENLVYTPDLLGERENMGKDLYGHERSDSSDRTSKGKSKRSSDMIDYNEKLEHAKRFKLGAAQLPISSNRETNLDGNGHLNLQKGSSNQVSFRGKLISDSQQSSRGPADVRSRKYAENSGHKGKYSELNSHTNEVFPMKNDKVTNEAFPMKDEKVHGEAQGENLYANQKVLPKNVKDGSVVEKRSTASGTPYKKHGERVGKLKDANSNIGAYSLPNDNNGVDVNRSPFVNGRGNQLQRELSDLELGELREPLTVETVEPKKQFERKSSFKKSESKPSSSDTWNVDSNKVQRAEITVNAGSKVKENETKRELVLEPVKEKTKQKPHSVAELNHRLNDALFTDGNSGNQQRESFSDEKCHFYMYEKEEPDLKGAIKDLSQYNKYVLEYREKYESYISIHNILEMDRKEFLKLGRELDLAKDRDMERYYNLVGHLQDTYRHCGSRHKRLKKIFIVLHEELKHLKQMIKDFADAFDKD